MKTWAKTDFRNRRVEKALRSLSDADHKVLGHPRGATRRSITYDFATRMISDLTKNHPVGPNESDRHHAYDDGEKNLTVMSANDALILTPCRQNNWIPPILQPLPLLSFPSFTKMADTDKKIASPRWNVKTQVALGRSRSVYSYRKVGIPPLKVKTCVWRYTLTVIEWRIANSTV